MNPNPSSQPSSADDAAMSDAIRDQISSQPVLLYMKGSPEMPKCGFSSRVVALLDECGTDYAFVDVLIHPDVRRLLPSISRWPTFPQLFVRGELIGGCDIVVAMHEKDELEPLLIKACEPTDF